MLIVTTENDILSQERAIVRALRRCADLFDLRCDKMPADIHMMMKYIHAHFFEPTLSVESIKAACGMRNHNVTTKFRQAVGMGMREYISVQRVEAAAAVLRALKVNIYLLAGAVGYTEEAFSRAFKERFGCSPLQYHLSKYNRDGQEN